MASKRERELAAMRAAAKKAEEPGPASSKSDCALPAVNPPVGERDGFVAVTVQMPPAMVLAIRGEGLRRKVAGEPNRTVSAIVREAVAALLGE